MFSLCRTSYFYTLSGVPKILCDSCSHFSWEREKKTVLLLLLCFESFFGCCDFFIFFIIFSSTMDVLPSGNIFHELQVVHDTGYFDGKVSPEEHWQQVRQSQWLAIFFVWKRLDRSNLDFLKTLDDFIYFLLWRNLGKQYISDSLDKPPKLNEIILSNHF